MHIIITSKTVHKPPNPCPSLLFFQMQSSSNIVACLLVLTISPILCNNIFVSTTSSSRPRGSCRIHPRTRESPLHDAFPIYLNISPPIYPTSFNRSVGEDEDPIHHLCHRPGTRIQPSDWRILLQMREIRQSDSTHPPLLIRVPGSQRRLLALGRNLAHLQHERRKPSP